MKKIIEHGFSKYVCSCYRCKCHFSYELEDIQEKDIVICPECGDKCVHNSCNWVAGSQMKDEPQPPKTTYEKSQGESV